MDIMEMLYARRTYRRFTQQPISEDIVADILDAAVIASAAANRQGLRYLAVQSESLRKQIDGLVKWAAFLPAEQGTPAPDQQPTLYVAVIQSGEGAAKAEVNAGLAMSNMTMAAYSHGVGSCIMGAIDRAALSPLLQVQEDEKLLYLVAFGYPSHKSTIVAMQGDDNKYYLDANGDYCVPKKNTDDVTAVL